MSWYTTQYVCTHISRVSCDTHTRDHLLVSHLFLKTQLVHLLLLVSSLFADPLSCGERCLRVRSFFFPSQVSLAAQQILEQQSATPSWQCMALPWVLTLALQDRIQRSSLCRFEPGWVRCVGECDFYGSLGCRVDEDGQERTQHNPLCSPDWCRKSVWSILESLHRPDWYRKSVWWILEQNRHVFFHVWNQSK